MTDTPTLVKQGVDLYAKAEKALMDAEEAILELRDVYPQAYANGHIAGADAITMRTSCIQLASAVSVIHDRVILHHKQSTQHAQEASQDVATPYAELPAMATGAHPMGDNR